MYIKNQYDAIVIDKKTIALEANQTIVENINRIISHIQNNTVLATKGKYHFAIKSIKELNDILVNPIEIISARPVQKTYPNINGIYLLLRSMGILRFEVSKKNIVMKIDEDLLKNWGNLNSTEQYFTLLEIWLIHSSPRELIDGFHELPFTLLNIFFRQNIAHSLKKTLEIIDFSSENYNLALFEMFGFVEIETVKPTTKNRWNITEITVKPLVKQIFPIVMIEKKDMLSFVLSKVELGYFQKRVQPHYKEYKNILQYPKVISNIGTYRLKISLHKAYRTIEINSSKSFQSLANAILEQFDFDNDHLYAFNFVDRFGKKVDILHSSLDGDGENLWADEYYLKNLPLKELEEFKFIFDFGDNWEFDILIENIDSSREIDAVKLIKSHGEAPEQYPDYDDYDDDEEW